MDVAGLALHERAQFGQPGAVQFQIHIDTLGSYVPAAAQGERAEALFGTIGAGGLPRAVDPPATATGLGWGNIEIRFGEVEDRFGVAELEVDAPVADMDGRGGAHHRGIHKGCEIPSAKLAAQAGLGQIDADVILQADRRDDESAAEQRPQAGPDGHGLHVSHRLNPDGGIFVNHDAVAGFAGLHGERRAGEETEVYLPDIDLPPQRSLKRPFEALPIAVGIQVRSHDAGHHQQGHDGDDGFQNWTELHNAAPVRLR